MAFAEETININPKENKVFKIIRKIMPITQELHGQKLFIKRMGILAATPLFLALVIIERQMFYLLWIVFLQF